MFAGRLPDEGRWLDLGTGGGLPGIVAALCRPGSRWTLVDATTKKVAAVAEFVAALELDNAVPVAGRAEELARAPEHRAAYDGVATRALAPLRVLAELARGFLRDGGTLHAMKGPVWPEEAAAATAALRQLGLRIAHTERLDVPGRESWVVTMQAEGPPPPAFPRGNGIPAKFPL